MSTTREDPQVAAIGGKLYVSGGYGFEGGALASSEAYDPATDRWTPVAANPDPHAGAGVAALAGSMYVVGGCTDTCGATDVLRYDANADSWTRLADYPEPVSFEACGAIDGLLYCAGGLAAGGSTSHGYVYDPAADTWSPIPDMPADFWGSGYAGANGQLLVSGGVIDDSTTLTNEAVAYDPAVRAWHSLPNADLPRYRGASACGFYQIGGGTSDANPSMADVQLLPGMDQCGASDVSWLSTDRTEFDLKPGHSVRVAVTTDASVVSGLGDYRAAVLAETDTPYPAPPVDVTMTVTARKHH
jgi:N-acetylneuraminic acid mutarotase